MRTPEELAEELRRKLKEYSREDIQFSDHTRKRLSIRPLTEDEIKQNLLKPDALTYAEEQESDSHSERQFRCYFDLGKKLCHEYVIKVNSRCKVITAIKVRKNWQRKFERQATR